jgi:hypothetical protein
MSSACVVGISMTKVLDCDCVSKKVSGPHVVDGVH